MMASIGGGIIRTESGRQTYAADGLESNSITHQSSEAATRSTSDTSDTIAAPDSGDHAYLDKDGKEEAEELPIEYQRANSVDHNTYEPIHAADRDTLTRLASHLSRNKSFRSTSEGDELERQNTLQGLELGDSVLDPSSPQFDLHKWIRMTMSVMDQDGIKVKRAGISFQNLNVSGSGSALNLQKNVGSFLMAPLRMNEFVNFGKKPVKQILRSFDGVLKSGEMLVVLGRPGSGCSTLLKSMTGEMHGLDLDKNSTVHYNGVTQAQMLKEFKGEVVYNQEVDKHFPHLTVGQTLEHAAALRAPSHRAMGVSRKEFVKHITQVVMAIYGLSHTYHTKVSTLPAPIYDDAFVADRSTLGGRRLRPWRFRWRAQACVYR